MINKFLLVIMILTTPCANSQDVVYPISNDSSIIKIKEFYKGYGKVFKSESEANRDIFGNRYPGNIMTDFKKNLKLTDDLIIKAEQLLFDELKKDNLKHYYRQYLGFINNEGDKIVLINLLNFKNKNKAKKYFTNWQNSLLIGHGEYYEKNQFIYLINISKGQVRRL